MISGKQKKVQVEQIKVTVVLLSEKLALGHLKPNHSALVYYLVSRCRVNFHSKTFIQAEAELSVSTSTLKNMLSHDAGSKVCGINRADSY